MVKRYKTASSRIEADKYFKFVAKCGKEGATPNEKIKKWIERDLNERTQEDERDSSGRSQEPEGPDIGAGTENEDSRGQIVNDIDP